MANLNGFVLQDRDAALARTFVEEYLSARGYTMKTICELPEEVAKQMMVEASVYASLKMAELDNRAHLVHELHGITQGEH